MPTNLTIALIILFLGASLVCDMANAGAMMTMTNPLADTDHVGGIISTTVFESHSIAGFFSSLFTAPIQWILAVKATILFDYPALNTSGLFLYVRVFFMAIGIAWLISFFLALVRGVPSR